MAANKNPYEAVGAAVARAKQLLAAGQPKKALALLEKLARIDIRGIYQGYPEYYETQAQCQKALGVDARNAENRHAEISLDWQEALSRGWKALGKGDAKESLSYFKRSINANPGDAGTAAAEYEAWRGMAEAYRRLGNDEAAEECMARIRRR